MTDLVKILQEGGFTVAEGEPAVRRMIAVVASNSTLPLCSGYRVFPGGAPCPGCPDCLGRRTP